MLNFRSLAHVSNLLRCNGRLKIKKFSYNTIPEFTKLVSRNARENQSKIPRLHARAYSTTPHTRPIKLTVNERSLITQLNVISIAMLVLGGTFAFVPIYKIVCQQTGLDGSVSLSKDTDMTDIELCHDRPLRIKFEGATGNKLRWDFKPQQSSIKLVPGETALAFYKARNRADKAITGLSTYNVIPFSAAQYFTKIQCFCFEEQRLAPGEEVDMPVFFYIDPEFADDPELRNVKEITLAYTFFESKNFSYEDWQRSLPEANAPGVSRTLAPSVPQKTIP